MRARRPIATGELLAIDPRVVRQDADAIFFLFSPYAPENEYDEGVACVHIRGPLDHHAGFGDNYDAIRQRAQEAFECEDAECVIFKIDSPGGAVSGLLDTVRAIRLMSEASGKPSIAYVDERAFSAAYAIASACDRIVLPRSGILGSIGVISTMAEQVERDEMMGYRYVTITSGARKSDGHIHVPITEDAEEAERERVLELAGQFFELVSDYRGLPKKRIDGFQAGLFLGQKAVKAGLADDVSTFDELLGSIKKGLAQNGTGVSTSTKGPTDGTENPAMLKGLRNALVTRIKETRQAIAKAGTDEKVKLEGKLSGLQAALEAYEKTTERHIEHHKTKESGDEDEDEEGNETDRGDSEEEDEGKGDQDEEEDEEARGGKSKRAAKGSSKASAKSKTKSRAMYDKEEEDAASEEDEQEASAEDEEDEEEEAALRDIVRRATGKTGVAARGALAGLMAKATLADDAHARVRRLERERLAEKKANMLASAFSSHRITKKEHASLAKQPMAYIQAYLDGRKSPLIVGDEGDLRVPDTNERGEAKLPDELENMLQQAVAASDGKVTREEFMANYKASKQHANGRGGPI